MRPTRAIEQLDTVEHVHDLRSIRADVLDWRRPDRSRDAGQALQTRQPGLDRLGDDLVPGHPGGGGQNDLVTLLDETDAGIGEAYDESGDTAIGNDDIRATAQNPCWFFPVLGPTQCLFELAQGV